MRSTCHAVPLAVLLGVLAVSGSARAETCDGTPSWVLETFPASGSHGAPRNGLALVVYCPPDDPMVDRLSARLLVDAGEAEPGCICPGATECLAVGFSDRCLLPVATRAVAEGDRVRLVTTDGDLAARTTYVIEAPEPPGPMRVSFTTGDELDESPPDFIGPRSVRFIGCGEGYSSSAACPTDEEGVVGVISADAADDVAGRVNVEYFVYSIDGEQLVERARARGDGASDVTVSFFLPASEVELIEEQEVCFRMGARDPYGQESLPDTAVCEFMPDHSPFGNACSSASGRGAPQVAAVTLVALVLVTVARRRVTRGRRTR